MKRNGRAPSGAQRWRCRSCGASATHSNDVAARELAAFVGWLLSRGTQADMPGRGRTFRRRAALFWPIWPMPEVVDEVFRVVYVDGIWIARDCVVLIACSDEHVLSWHLARAGTTAAWRSLLSRIAPPDMVVTDGGSGFASAVAAEWPRTRGPEMRVPRVLPGQEAYDVEAQAAGGRRALRAGQGVAACGDAPAGRLVGRALHAVVRVLVRLPRAEKPGRRPHGLHPPQAARGEVGARPARQRGDAVHVPRPGAVRRGADARHQQQDRRGRELPAPRGPEEPPRPHEAQARQGRVLVVLPACRMPEDDGGHAARDAHRRRRRPAEGAIRHEGRGRLPSREVGRGPRVGGAPPQDEIPVPKRMNNRPRHTFCPIGRV